MTTYTWPDTRPFRPHQLDLRVVDGLQRVHESPLSGAAQTQSMPGARWGWSYALMPHSVDERRAIEAWLIRLSGREHRVRMWDIRAPRPLGNIALSGVTLGAAAAQFATSLQLAGCYPTANLIRYPVDLRNTAETGSSRPWSEFDDTTNGVLVTLVSIADPTGSASQVSKIQGSAIGASPIGVSQSLGAIGASQQAIVSAYFRAAECSQVNLQLGTKVPRYPYVGVNLTSGAATVTADSASGVAGGATNIGGGWWRVWMTANVGSGASTPNFIIRLRNGAGDFVASSAGDGLYAWGAMASLGDQLVDFEANATLKDGDWLGLANGQLVRVVDPATANAAGAMTVEVRHMLRAALSGGSAVTLDKPTALYVRTESGLVMPRQAGMTEPGMSIDFVEVFA